MTNTAKTLTFVIPAYNMESYLDRCVNSLLSASDTRDLEVLIVDDGSKDGTLEYARKLERTNPGVVRAIHQENKGHGGAVNTGIAAATGMYVKFYYSYQPFPWVKRIQYLDVPFYHYFIGREGQSVQTDVMIRRVDQLRLVNRLMTEATPERGTVPEGLYRYMIHFLAIESCVTSAFLILSRDPANYVKKTELWDAIDAYSPAIGKDVRAKLMSRALNLPGKPGRWIVRNGYLIAERIVGFN